MTAALRASAAEPLRASAAEALRGDAAEPLRSDAAEAPVLDQATLDQVACFLAPAAVIANLRLLAGRSDRLLQDLAIPPGAADAGMLAQDAHAVAGSAGLLGFRRLSESCIRFEHACTARQADAPEAATRLRAALEASLAEMARQVGGR